MEPLASIDLLRYANQVASADDAVFENQYLALRSIHSMVKWMGMFTLDGQIRQLRSLKSMAEVTMMQFDTSFPAD
jgi:hypothetical protein